jgi:hypothetical protein
VSNHRASRPSRHPEQQLSNLDLACPGPDSRSTHPYGADQAHWTPAAAGSKSHKTPATGRRPLQTGRRRGVELHPVVSWCFHSQAMNVVLAGRATTVPFTAVPAVPSGQSWTTPQRPRPAPFRAVAGDQAGRSGFASRWSIGRRFGIGLPCPASGRGPLSAKGPGTPYGVRDGRDRRSSAGAVNLSCAMIPMLD